MPKDKTPLEFIESQLKDISEGYLVAYMKDGNLHWKANNVVVAHGLMTIIKDELKFMSMLATEAMLQREEGEIDDGE